jgi:hypothetical protein
MPQLARSESASAGSGFSVGVGDRHPELARVLDPLGGEGGDRAFLDVRLVRLPHRAQVEVGERVAGDDQEGVGLAEEVADLADASRGPERLGLLAVGDPEAELRAVPEDLPDLLGQVGEIGDDVREPMLAEQLGDPGDYRPVQHRSDRLRHQVGERPEPRPQPRRQDHRPHREGFEAFGGLWTPQSFERRVVLAHAPFIAGLAAR